MKLVSFATSMLAFLLLAGTSFGQSSPSVFVVVAVDDVFDTCQEVEVRVEVGDIITEEELECYLFDDREDPDDDTFLVLRHKLTNLDYRVESASSLSAFFTAFSNAGGDGLALGRWLVGGNRQSLDISTITSTIPVSIPEGEPAVTPEVSAATAVSPTQ